MLGGWLLLTSLLLGSTPPVVVSADPCPAYITAIDPSLYAGPASTSASYSDTAITCRTPLAYAGGVYANAPLSSFALSSVTPTAVPGRVSAVANYAPTTVTAISSYAFPGAVATQATTAQCFIVGITPSILSGHAYASCTFALSTISPRTPVGYSSVSVIASLSTTQITGLDPFSETTVVVRTTPAPLYVSPISPCAYAGPVSVSADFAPCYAAVVDPFVWNQIMLATPGVNYQTLLGVDSVATPVNTNAPIVVENVNGEVSTSIIPNIGGSVETFVSPV